MNRIFKRLASMSLIVLATGGAAKAADAPAAKPNVLFIAVDDLKPVLGCYGDKTVKSPNIDRLAKQGTIFTHAYCMQAVCSPSRNAVLTGLLPESLRIYDLNTFFRRAAPDVTTLPQLFKESGWQSHGIGKILHLGQGNHEDPTQWSVPHTYPGGGYALPENKRFNGKDAKGPAVEIADVPDNSYTDGKIADLAIKRLQAFAEKKETFFLATGFIKPHLPFTAPKKYWDLYDRKQFHLPDRQTLPDGAPKFAGHNSGELRSYSDIPEVGPITNEKALELIHGYHAAVTYTDAQIGRVLDELDRLHLRDNTIIVLWGDHGWHLGDHGLWCKHTDYEQATRAPLIISAPNSAHPGSTCSEVVEFVDIYPTLCDLAGLKQPSWLQGYSLKPALDDPSAKIGKSTAFQVYPRSNNESGAMLGQSIRTDRWRLVEWQKKDRTVVARELYDYENDPDETVNLATKPELAATVNELSAAIKARLDAPKPAGVVLRDPTAKE